MLRYDEGLTLLVEGRVTIEALGEFETVLSQQIQALGDGMCICQAL